MIEAVVSIKLLTMSSLQEIFDNFSCKICYSQYTQWNTPTVICQNHHLVCQQCYKELVSCPYCKEAILSKQVTYKQLFVIKEAVMKKKEPKKKLKIASECKVKEAIKQQIQVADDLYQKLLRKNLDLKEYIKGVCRKPQLLKYSLPKMEKQFQKLQQQNKALNYFLQPISNILLRFIFPPNSSREKSSFIEFKSFLFPDLLQSTSRLKSRLKQQRKDLHKLQQEVNIKKKFQSGSSKILQKQFAKQKVLPPRIVKIQ